MFKTFVGWWWVWEWYNYTTPKKMGMIQSQIGCLFLFFLTKQYLMEWQRDLNTACGWVMFEWFSPLLVQERSAVWVPSGLKEHETTTFRTAVRARIEFAREFNFIFSKDFDISACNDVNISICIRIHMSIYIYIYIYLQIQTDINICI